LLNNKDGTAAEGKFSKKKQTHPKERKERKGGKNQPDEECRRGMDRTIRAARVFLGG